MTRRFPNPGFFSCSLALALTACGGMSERDLTENESSRARTVEKEQPKNQTAPEPVEPEEESAPVTPEAPDAVTVIEPDVEDLDDRPAQPATAPPSPAEQDGAATEQPTDEEPGFALEIVDDLSVLVIFDNSGSMSGYWDGGSRWAVANQALYDSLAPVATSLKVAAIRFPVEGECGVPDFTEEVHFGWQLAGEFLDEWQSRALPPNGGTPMGQAFLAADEAIAQADEQGLLEDRFNVIVLTDGEPNCETDAALLTMLPAYWNEKGVKTHVLGLPGSDQAADLLNAIANAGGTGEFVSLGNVPADQLVHEVTALAR